MHLLQKRPTKIGTRLLGSKMPVPIPRSRTVMGSHGYKRVEAIFFVRIFKTIQIYLSIVIPAGDLNPPTLHFRFVLRRWLLYTVCHLPFPC